MATIVLLVGGVIIRDLGINGTPPPPLQELQQQVRDCANAVPSPAFENVTLELAELFGKYATNDALPASAARMAGAIAAFRRHEGGPTADDNASAAQLPNQERAATAATLRTALEQCKALRDGTRGRPVARSPLAPTMAALGNVTVGATGHFISGADGRPYFLLGFNGQPVPDPQRRAALAFGASWYYEHSVTLRWLFCPYLCPADAPAHNVSWAAVLNMVSRLDAAAAAGLKVSLMLGHGRQRSNASPTGTAALPEWAEAAYPGITTNTGRTSFVGYDVDHPGARELWAAALSALVPAVARHPALLSWSLANEPALWAANSTFTFAAFGAWLNRTYAGNVSALSAEWQPGAPLHLSGFDDAALVPAMGNRRFSARQVIDWTNFNMARGSAWFEWLCGRIKAASAGAPTARCHAKFNNVESPLGRRHANGFDRVRLSRSLDWQDCDTRTIYTRGNAALAQQQFPQRPNDTFAFDALDMAGSYAFMRSVAPPATPLLDSEWHSVSTVTFRDAALPATYMRAVTWLAAVHGLSAVNIWYWARRGWDANATIGAEFGGADVAFSLMTQPAAADAFLRTHREINALAEHVTTVAAAPRRVFLLYSEASAVAAHAHEASQWSVPSLYLDHMLAAVSLTQWLPGAGVGFLPARDLMPGGRGLPLGLGALLVPSVTHIDDAALDAVRRLATSSGNGSTVPVVVVGNSTSRPALFSRDELDRLRPASARAWASSLPLVDVGGQGGADAGAYAELARVLVPAVTPRARTHDAATDDSDGTSAGGHAPGAASPLACFAPSAETRPRSEPPPPTVAALIGGVFGVVCRSAGNVAVLVNTLRDSVAVGVRCGNGGGGGNRNSSSGSAAISAIDLWTQRPVALPLVLASMDVRLLQVVC